MLRRLSTDAFTELQHGSCRARSDSRGLIQDHGIRTSKGWGGTARDTDTLLIRFSPTTFVLSPRFSSKHPHFPAPRQGLPRGLDTLLHFFLIEVFLVFPKKTPSSTDAVVWRARVYGYLSSSLCLYLPPFHAHEFCIHRNAASQP